MVKRFGMIQKNPKTGEKKSVQRQKIKKRDEGAPYNAKESRNATEAHCTTPKNQETAAKRGDLRGVG